VRLCSRSDLAERCSTKEPPCCHLRKAFTNVTPSLSQYSSPLVLLQLSALCVPSQFCPPYAYKVVRAYNIIRLVHNSNLRYAFIQTPCSRDYTHHPIANMRCLQGDLPAITAYFCNTLPPSNTPLQMTHETGDINTPSNSLDLDLRRPHLITTTHVPHLPFQNYPQPGQQAVGPAQPSAMPPQHSPMPVDHPLII